MIQSFIKITFVFFLYSLTNFAQPNFETGKLPNGLTYYIHNKENTDMNYFFLVIKIGSINENNHQKGYAHFLEHMAFKGGKQFTKKRM